MRVRLATTVHPHLDHVGPLERSQADVTVVRRASDLAELLAAARSGLVDAVLVAGDTELVTRAFLDEVRRAPRPVGVLALTDVPDERRRLRALGVPALALDAQDPLAVARTAQDAARAAVQGVLPDTGAVADAEPDDRPVPAAAGEPGPAEAGEPTWEPAPTSAAASPSAAGLGVLPGPDAPDPGVVPHALAGPGDVRSVPAVDSSGAGAGDDGPRLDGGTSEPLRSGPSAAPTEEAAGSARGRVVVVWGPTGAPGRTTVAVNVAAELAAAGVRTLLVDADTYGPAVGALLGLTEESAGVARAARQAERDRVTAADLRSAAVRVRVAGGDLDVLTGLTRTDRWPEVRGGAVAAVLEAAREGWERIVVDVGFCLEEDEELSFDVPAPQRNGATLGALAAADRVLAVGGADAVGLPRLVRGVEALVALAPAAEAGVVVNRLRPRAAGVSPRAQVDAVWARYGPDVPVVAHLPWDPAAADRALLGGQALAEAAPTSPLRRSLRDLALAEGPGRAGEACAVGRRRRLLPWSPRSSRTP